ncbi:hypothetical protein G7Y89_g8200 [Cudoniella acicularis]|uniref:Uncharacterized protein n=1 Tax=Cudoniella acicularis TaxID=354080 RepID=A0A8H4W1A8_9HELO|nr:hypothetical protein G7Y89_g8200 [Cudoniella acicularis]
MVLTSMTLEPSHGPYSRVWARKYGLSRIQRHFRQIYYHCVKTSTTSTLKLQNFPKSHFYLLSLFPSYQPPTPNPSLHSKHLTIKPPDFSNPYQFNKAKMKAIAILLFTAASLLTPTWTFPHGAHAVTAVAGRSMAVGPIIEEAGEGYEAKKKRSMAVGPIIEEAGEGYEAKRSMTVGPILEEAGEGYES